MPVNEHSTQINFRKTFGNAAGGRNLISVERTQKLDLLSHLLANLRKSVVVCGAEGIGKTTMLETLLNTRKDQWHMLFLSGSSNLSFESVIYSLSSFLQIPMAESALDLSLIRNFCETQKVVLIIDDAGELIPGLIDELLDLAESLFGLSLVFAMTYDAFHIKNKSDKTIEDCHFIEIPAFTQRECTDFLQNLSAQPGALISFNAITDNLVEKLYKETHGIPGRILKALPELNESQSRISNISPLWIWLGIGVLCLIASIWIFKALFQLVSPVNSTQTQTAIPQESGSLVVVGKLSPIGSESTAPISETQPAIKFENPAVLQNLPEKKAIENPPEQLETPAITLNENLLKNQIDSQTSDSKQNSANNQNSLLAQPTEPAKPSTDITKTDQTIAAQQIEPPPAQTPVVPSQNLSEPKAEQNKPIDSLDWINAQPAENYTLQVMILSTKEAAVRFLKKNKEMDDKLKYYTINQNGKDKYIVIYGSFTTIAEAKNLMVTLPKEFQTSVEKKFKHIQTKNKR